MKKSDIDTENQDKIETTIAGVDFSDSLDALEALSLRFDKMVSKVNKLTHEIKGMDKSTHLINVDNFYSINEVSKMCGISEYILRKEVKGGKLKHIYRAKRMYFKKDQVEAYLKS